MKNKYLLLWKEKSKEHFSFPIERKIQRLLPCSPLERKIKSILCPLVRKINKALTMKIALLICDELADCLKPQFGDYKVMFEKLLNHPVLAYDARKMEFPAEETLDGIIISGSSTCFSL